MIEPKFRICGTWGRWAMDCIGIAGLTLPNGVIYLHPKWATDDRLQRHELAHVDQINRDGPARWCWNIVWYYIRYGYRYSPYEIEARKAEAEC